MVRGIGNSRSEVARDPGAAGVAAEALGRELFERRYTDYRLDTQRSGRVWAIDPDGWARGAYAGTRSPATRLATGGRSQRRSRHQRRTVSRLGSRKP